jgi:hypothetical protein
MIDINKEAEEYGFKTNNGLQSVLLEDAFIAGHNSKATQAKMIQAQIDVLKELELSDYDVEYGELREYRNKIRRKVFELQQQLKQLENDTTN